MKHFEELLKKLLLTMEPESAHNCAMTLLKMRSHLPSFSRKGAEYTCFGLKFANRVGLAAGFDKNAENLLAWQKLGFGFAEVGTVTALPQEGNPKPRIFRFPEKHSLLNRMGFNNDGCDAIASRIEKQRKSHKITIPIGINIGKSKVAPLEDASPDYLKSFKRLADLADYIVVNVSSPNTPGLRHLQNTEHLKPLLQTLCNENAKRKVKRPLLLKLSPDLEVYELREIADLALQLELQALVLTNTSTDFSLIPDSEKHAPGGLSGSVLFQKSTECLHELSKHLGGKLPLIASGGVMSAQDAKAKVDAGAHLVQIYTGFVYKGPQLIREIVDIL